MLAAFFMRALLGRSSCRYILFFLCCEIAGTSLLYSQDLVRDPTTGQTERVVIAAEELPAPYVADSASTATKTDAPLIETPVSVQVIPRQVFEDEQDTTASDALRNVSGVQPSQSDNRSEHFVIRGFDGGTPPSVDNILFKQYFNAFTDLVNIERIEVLKGPASVLYGANAPGGLINLVSKVPGGRFGFDLETSGGSFGYSRTTLDLNLPLLYRSVPSAPATDTDGKDGKSSVTTPVTREPVLALRLDGAFERSDTFRDLFFPEERWTVAPALRWNVAPGTVFTLYGLYQNEHQEVDPTVIALPNGRIPNVPRSFYYGEPFTGVRDELEFAHYLLEHRFASWLYWTSYGGYQNFESHNAQAFPLGYEADNRTLDRIYGPQIEHDYQWVINNDLHFSFDTWGVHHALTVGTEYGRFSEHQGSAAYDLAPIDIYTLDRTANPIGALQFSGDFKFAIRDFGAYVQDQIRLWDKVTVVGGVRYDDFKVRSDAQVSADNDFSPRVGLLYNPIKSVALFANWSHAFTPQTGLLRGGGQVKPLEAEDFDVGAKAAMLNGKLQATLSLYHLKQKNLLSTDPTDSNFSIETGEQKSRGVEFDLAAEPVRGWQVIASASYIEAHIYDTQGIASGKEPQNVPNFSGRLFTTYAFGDRGWAKGLKIGAGVSYVGNRSGNDFGQVELPSYTTVDALASYRVNRHLRLFVNGKNIFDRKYFLSSLYGQVLYGEPASVLGGAEVSW